MCLGIPGAVLERYEEAGVPMAWVDFGGVRREVCMAYVPEAQVGDYVIVHVGFAISVLDEAEAQETLGLLEAALGTEVAEQEERPASAAPASGWVSESPLGRAAPKLDA